MSIYKEIKAERQRQIDKFGDQSHVPNYSTWPAFRDATLPNAFEARQACDLAFMGSRGSYLHILTEEVCEAAHEAAEGNPEALREELIQVAAVCVAWLEKLT